MMGKIPARLGLTAILVFGLVAITLVYFAAGFRVPDVMEVPLSIRTVSPGAQPTVTAVVAKNRVGKIHKGDQVELALPGKTIVHGVVTAVNVGVEEGFVAINVDDPSEHLIKSPSGNVYGKIKMGEKSMMDFFFR